MDRFGEQVLADPATTSIADGLGAPEDQVRQQAQTYARRLELALDAGRMGVIEIDFGAHTIWSSPEVEEILGQQPAFSSGSTPWPMCHPEDRARLDAHLSSAWKAQRLAAFDFRIVRPGGEVRWIQIHSLRESIAPGGEANKVVVLVIDIDDRKRQELALSHFRQEVQANAERLSLALGAAGAGVAELDFQARRIWCSPEFIRLVGRDVDFEDFNGSEAWPFCHPEDVQRFLQMARNWREPRHEPFDFRIVLPSGETRWVEAHGERELDENGRARRVVALLVDIDARKRQELALAQARQEAQANAERLKLALDAAGAGVFETNFKDETFWCSPQLIRIIGRKLTFKEANGPWPMVHPDDTVRLREFAQQSMQTGSAHRLEMRIVLPDGETRWIESRIENHGGAVGDSERVVGFILDIDERKRQELSLIKAENAAQAAAEAKAQFLANMSHELRTPMNGVLGVLHLLGEEPLTEGGRRLLTEAEQCGRMLAQLLNDVVDFSKIEAGRLELSPEPVDAAELLASVARLLKPEADAKGVELRTRVEGYKGLVRADPVRFRQVLFNLIGNAVKFTSEGHVEARLSLTPSAGANRLRLEVADTGIGISPEARASLFQRFQQADGSTARVYGGSGLGLAITRALAQMMGGEVDCESTPGKGSTFWFDVPVEPASAPAVPGEAAQARFKGLSTLVVEDNATNRLVISRLLESLGARVEAAADGLEGLELVKTGRFDLVLMDVQMPRMDGVEATRRIRALEGKVARTPIIGLTANVLDHQRHDYVRAGMDAIAGKPINVPELVSQIAVLLQGRGGEEAA
jgi:PAS domain S-box-containing protein